MVIDHVTMLILPDNLREKIFGHALASYPYECCGALVGTIGVSRAVKLIIALKNIEVGNSARYRYSIASDDLLALSMEVNNSGGEILGFYHSHPFASNLPSLRDMLLAWPEYSYLIVSFAGKKRPQVRSWRLIDKKRGFREEIISKQA